jgi:hypothetical protein
MSQQQQKKFEHSDHEKKKVTHPSTFLNFRAIQMTANKTSFHLIH